MKVTPELLKSIIEIKKMSLRRFSIETDVSACMLSQIINGHRKIGVSTEIKITRYIENDDKAWFIANIKTSSELSLSEEEVELLKLLRAFPDIKIKVLNNLKYREKMKLDRVSYTSKY